MYKSILIILVSVNFGFAQSHPEGLADLQLKGYNERDIDLFLQAYSDTVKVFNFPNTLQYKGKENMKLAYEGMFAKNPDLHCTIKSRIVIDNTVIDEEDVIFSKDRPVVHAVAIYKMGHGKIQEVYFITR